MGKNEKLYFYQIQLRTNNLVKNSQK